jgi:hypothetical protein
MPPRRRDRQTPDPPEEREMSRRRGRQMTDPAMEREMRDLRARLEDMETTQRHTVSAGDHVEEDKKVKHVVTRLKGHATLWWDELQADRRCKGKKKIKSWDRMIAKMKVKFIPRDYQITLFRRMQNLRQKMMTVKEYTEEFYKLNIRAGHRESDDEKVSRYMNGLRYDIQDEMSMVTI